MIDEKKLDLNDWEDNRFVSDISNEYKSGFNHSLFLIRSQIKNALNFKGELK